MKKVETTSVCKQDVAIDLGDATKNTLGTTRAGVREMLGVRRYRN